MSSEILNKIKEDAAKLLEEASVIYLKCYAYALFDKVKKELKDSGESDLKLSYRKWKFVREDKPFSGEVYVKVGQGPGSFSRWKKVFLKENRDHDIEAYSNAKDAANPRKKPKMTIKVAGYEVIEDFPASLRDVIALIAQGIELTEEEQVKLASFSQYSWALAHPCRESYIFQLHEEKEGACCGLGGGNQVLPVDAGSENAEARDEWVEFMQECIGRAEGTVVDRDSVSGKAFKQMLKRLAENHKLEGWDSEGREADMLTDFLVETLVKPIEQSILDTLKGPVSIRLAVYYKTKGKIHSTLSSMVTAAWRTMQEGARQLDDRIVQVIKEGITPIIKMAEEITNKILQKIGGLLQSSLDQVMPAIKDWIKDVSKPLIEGYVEGKNILSEYCKIDKLPDDSKKMKRYLDNIPRDKSKIKGIKKATRSVKNNLKNLKSGFFIDINPSKLSEKAQNSYLKVLDAAVHTLQEKVDKNGKSEEALEETIKEYEADVEVHLAELKMSMLVAIISAAFKRVSGASGLDQQVEEFQDQIPDEMKEILNIISLLTSVITDAIKGRIQKVVQNLP